MIFLISDSTAEIKAKQLQQQLSIYEIKNQVRSLYYQIEYLQFNKQNTII